MLQVSDKFKNEIMQPITQITSYIETENDIINNDTDLVNFKITVDGQLHNTVLKQIDIKLLNDYTYLLDTNIKAHLGVVDELGQVEYIHYGTFIITEVTLSKDKEYTSLKGYDLMILTHTKYDYTIIDYPTTVKDFAKAIAENCGLDLIEELKDSNNQVIYSFDNLLYSDLELPVEYYQNIYDIRYRDVLKEIAQITNTIAIIRDNKLYFKELEQTNEILTYDNLLSFELSPKFGPVNSLVLSQTPQEDNIYLQDEEDIELNGLCEYRIDNNQMIDKRRMETIEPIYEAIKGLEFTPFDVKTEGLGYFETGDKISIVTSPKFNDEGIELEESKTYESIVLSYTIEVDGSIKETLKTDPLETTSTNYDRASGITDRIKNTEIIVDKQQQYIESIVSDSYMDGKTPVENFTQIYQDINNIQFNIQKGYGTNIIKNSVMYDNKNLIPADWLDYTTKEEKAVYNIMVNMEAQKNIVSNYQFVLFENSIIQYINDINIDLPYSLSVKLNKNTVGSCFVEIGTSVDTYTIELLSGNDSDWNEFEIENMKFNRSDIYVRLWTSDNAKVGVTDLMLVQSETRQSWTQAQGEYMNSNVIMNEHGITVKSALYKNDYTHITPLEFAGYHNDKRIFSLNKDITEVEKLNSKKQIEMPPIKIVPVTDMYINGWAFVQKEDY